VRSGGGVNGGLHARVIVAAVEGHLAVQAHPEDGEDEEHDEPQAGDVGDGRERVDERLDEKDHFLPDVEHANDPHELH